MNKISSNDGERIVRSKRAESIRNRNPGWMAFDIEQRRKQQGLRSDDLIEDYPALAGHYPKKTLLKKHSSQLDKPFSSVVGGSVDTRDGNQQKTAVPAITSSMDKPGNADASQKLGDLHSWADESFIQDVLAAVNEDVDESSRFLEEMLVGGNDHITTYLDAPADGKIETSRSFHDSLNDSRKIHQFLALPMLPLDSLKSCTVEPEFDPALQEQDVYLLHRKDAIKMMRSASRLSNSANEAYLRGDHVSARNFSRKARDQWNSAQNLNIKAANEILSSRNLLNDIWRLDLHGLHAAEAIAALQQRLQTVENLVSQDQITTSNVLLSESRILPLPSDPPRSEKLGKQKITSGHRPRLLQVITGKGNHSQGPASLPSTVKSFLSENRYHFDERPGMILIRPKFRQH